MWEQAKSVTRNCVVKAAGMVGGGLAPAKQGADGVTGHTLLRQCSLEGVRAYLQLPASRLLVFYMHL